MDMEWILWPPVAFTVIALFVAFQAYTMKFLAPKGSDSYGKRKPYACGEDIYEHRIRPDYGQFFSYAFFFTIMHVMAMMMTTVPKTMVWIGLFYVVIGIGALLILFKQLMKRRLL